ncbi:MAG: hypothetical protein JW741_02820 [Sedimentisphaerales bacterium]|nr:hypothetical protein [Sedimentisphaerales bacterium]
MRQKNPPPGWKTLRHDARGGTSFERITDGLQANGSVGGSVVDTAKEKDEILSPRWARLAERYRNALTKPLLRQLADQLGVDPEALRRLDVGWHTDLQCWTFPHFDHLRRVVGIGTRYTNGRKRFLKRSHPGLHIPEGLDEMPDLILLVEGPSDTAACLSMGLAAIGRPNNYGNIFLGRAIGKRECIVVGDFDPKPTGLWPGKEGAEAVARQLAAELRRPVPWALAPDGHKDIRDWLAAQEIRL